ncbi:MAG: hypothetical protein HZB16_13290 [Armatimonadetes bacterium]|nr:hypothetical protein [Armatimonadota bacterium]
MTALLLLAGLSLGQPNAAPFGLRVIDEQTGRGVPLVEVRSVHERRWVTDSAGWAAITEPELMGRHAFFHLSSHGYEYPKDGFGNRGLAVDVTPGGRVTVKIKRINVAERLYRITGAGIYADSVQLGERVPIAQPLLNGGVLGQDSCVPAVYRGRIYWFWGDTNRVGYPLGNFNTTGAVSDLPGQGGLSPELGVNLTYFGDGKGFVKGMCPIEGPGGPVWLESVVALPDAQGRERLFCCWSKVDANMAPKTQGIGMWNDERNVFEPVTRWEPKIDWHPFGQPYVRDGFCYFGAPWPVLRCRATAEAIVKLDSYEAYLPAADGYAWRPAAKPITQEREAELIKNGTLRADQARFQVRDVDGGKPVSIHTGTVRYNAYLKQWVMIGVQNYGGPSFLGEVWYATAPEATGPWTTARKVLTHDKYSFYNPRQDEFLDGDGGRYVYFEGTYATTFSRQGEATPRYDYNQMMYRLDLAAIPR